MFARRAYWIAAGVTAMLLWVPVQAYWRVHAAIATVDGAGGLVTTVGVSAPLWGGVRWPAAVDALRFGVETVDWPQGPLPAATIGRLVRASAVLQPRNCLAISGVRLDAESFGRLANRVSVRTLMLSNCTLPATPLKSWASGAAPTKICLTGVRCPKGLLTGLESMPSLRELEIENVRLASGDVNSIARTPKLESLRLKSVGLPDDGRLPPSPSGERLWLVDTPFEPQDLRRWPRLKTLDIDHTMAPLVDERGHLPPEVRLKVWRRWGRVLVEQDVEEGGRPLLP